MTRYRIRHYLLRVSSAVHVGARQQHVSFPSENNSDGAVFVA